MGLHHILVYPACQSCYLLPGVHFSPQRHPSWSPPSSCSSLEWLLFRPAVQLSAWDFPSLPSWVGSTVSWIPCLPLFGFIHIFPLPAQIPLECNLNDFLRGAVWEAFSAAAYQKMSSLCFCIWFRELHRELEGKIFFCINILDDCSIFFSCSGLLWRGLSHTNS